LFQDFITVLCWIYLYLSFWEPAHENDDSLSADSNNFLGLLIVESFIIFVFLIDAIFRIVLRYESGKRTKFRDAFCESSFIINTICVTAFVVDAILFFSLYPTPYFRFSRYMRPMKLTIESRTVSKTLRAIGKTIPQIIDVLTIMVIINSLYALVGNRILPHDIEGLSVSIPLSITSI
jgi:amino acid transporter